jgi:hypothetical protein
VRGGTPESVSAKAAGGRAAENARRGRSLRLLGTGFRIRSGVRACGRRRSERSGRRQPRALALENGVKGDLPCKGNRIWVRHFCGAR